ncbi:MAG: hypothetical protein ACTSRS_06530 [Candidatus Helarchaeota archaeon]
MGKREYLPPIVILLMWFSTISTGLSTPLLDATQQSILGIVSIPLLVAILIALLRIYRENKNE